LSRLIDPSRQSNDFSLPQCPGQEPVGRRMFGE
jgi:hypothetical protein